MALENYLFSENEYGIMCYTNNSYLLNPHLLFPSR